MESFVRRLAIVWRFVHEARGNAYRNTEAVVQWSRGQEFTVENLAIEPHTQPQLQQYVKRLGDCPVSDDRLIPLGFPVTLMLSIVCLAAPAWADLNAGMDAYHRGDYATALREWQPLAEQGHAVAQYNLGLLYANGQGVTKDDAKARQWYEKSAIQGHADAQVNLGILFVYGRGVPQDYKMAVYWLRLSANQGNDLAQRKFGLMYERGDGVPQDYVQAYMWYNLGTANGAKPGAVLRDALAKRMTPDQIAEAQQLAREWKPKGK